MSHLKQCGAHHESYKKESVNIRKLSRMVQDITVIEKNIMDNFAWYLENNLNLCYLVTCGVWLDVD